MSMYVPPLHAEAPDGVTHTTIGIGDELKAFIMSVTELSSPPGVFNSYTIRLEFPASASAIERVTSSSVVREISELILTISTLL